MKPARSPQTTGFLPSRPTRRLDVLEHVGLGDHGADDLDEVLHRRGVEEVDADDAAGVGVGGGDLGDAEARGVGGQDRLRLHDRLELAEDRLLDLDRLDDRLDHEVGVGEVLHARGEGDPAEQRRLVLLAQLAARDGASGGVLEVLATALDGLVVDLDADHREAVAGEHLRDAGAHGAETDHADRGEVAGRLRGAARHGRSPTGPARRGCSTPRDVVAGRPTRAASDTARAAASRRSAGRPRRRIPTTA